MKMERKKNLIALAAAAVAFALIWMLGPGAQGLTGGTPVRGAHLQLVGHSNPNDKRQVVIGLELRNEKELEELLQAQADPRSPSFRKYLTPEEFTARFGPTQADYQAAQDFLTSKELTIVSTTPNRLLIVCEGTVAQLEKAFKTNINRYQWHDSKGNLQEGLSNSSDPVVPDELRGVIASVNGLNNISIWESRYRNVWRPGMKERLHQFEPWGKTPHGIATAYNFPSAHNRQASAGMSYTGAGRTIAIATAFTYDPKDLDAFWKGMGTNRTGKVENIFVRGSTKELNGETTLDIQQAGSAAPGADILVYAGIDAEDDTFSLVFNRIVTDNRADIMSISWGLCEHQSLLPNMKTQSNIFKQAAAQGIAVFAASGDNGAYDCGGKDTNLGVDYTSSDPYVVAVGGTSLDVDEQQRRSKEVTWNGSGGGVSGIFPRPFWQTAQGLPGGDKRLSADLAMNADPWTGYAFYYQGHWEILGGGTSFGAPNAAGLWALIDEGCGVRIGSPGALIYNIARSKDYGSIFYDVTVGHNGTSKLPGYKAGAGWDHPTGWGVPNGTALLAAVKNYDQYAPAPVAPAVKSGKLQTDSSHCGGCR